MERDGKDDRTQTVTKHCRRASIFVQIALLGLTAWASEADAQVQPDEWLRPRAVAAAAVEPIAMIDIGTLGGSWAEVVDINRAGQVLGNSQTSSGESQAFVWEDGVMTPVTGLMRAIAFNSSGQLIGQSTVGRFVFWENGTTTDIGTLPGGESSWVKAINEAGEVLGTSTTTTHGYPLDYWNQHAFIWKHGVMTDLGTLVRNTSDASLVGGRTYAHAMNDLGQVVGSSMTYASPGAPYHPFLWKDGVMMELLGRRGLANALNNAGQVLIKNLLWEDGTITDLGDIDTTIAISESGKVLGGIATASGGVHAALWADGVTTDLGTLGGSSSSAVAMNEVGQIVGTSATLTGEDRPFIWEDGLMVELETLPGDLSTGVVGISESSLVAGNVKFWDRRRAIVWKVFSVEEPSPEKRVEKILAYVETLTDTGTLDQGFSNSLGAKLEAALGVLGDPSANNDSAAVKLLEAFVSEIDAQRGERIPTAEADILIALAVAVIEALNEL